MIFYLNKIITSLKLIYLMSRNILKEKYIEWVCFSYENRREKIRKLLNFRFICTYNNIENS